MVICGDFNVAPDDRDAWDPAKLHGGTHISPPEREAVAALQEWGLVDVFRRIYPQPGIFSWWDYRAGDFHQGRGLRIDLVLATKSLADRATWAIIDRQARKGKLPVRPRPLDCRLRPLSIPDRQRNGGFTRLASCAAWPGRRPAPRAARRGAGPSRGAVPSSCGAGNRRARSGR